MTGDIVEIVILAMIAAFLGLRLYSVLGERAEHEEEAITSNREAAEDRSHDMSQPAARPNLVGPAPARPEDAPPVIERGVRAIASATGRFEILTFLEGAKGAYQMILEAFWKGDRETLKQLCDDDVFASFCAAIDAREQAGEVLDNRLVRIEETKIEFAELDGRTARIGVLFVADIAAVTRDGDGNVIAGSLDDAVESRDVWTFSRDVKSDNPDWLLDETDEG